jgi:flagellar biosynthesis chaperone FliJ
MSDPRGFRYALQALLLKQRWHLEALQCTLAQAMRQRRAAELALEQLQQRQHEVRLGAAAAGRQLDPQRAQAIVNYLCQLTDRIREQTERRDAVYRECEQRRRDCAAAQARLDEIEKHRAGALQAHWREQSRIQAAVADEQWTMNWTRGGSPTASEST